MSDPPSDLRTMPEARLREWFGSLPQEELVEMFVSYVRAYMRERDTEAGGMGVGPLGDFTTLTFAQLIDRLKETLRLPELSRFSVEGERVVYVRDSGLEIPINATGESDAVATGAGPRSLNTPPVEQPPDAHILADPPPRRESGGLFGSAPQLSRGAGTSSTSRPAPVRPGPVGAGAAKPAKKQSGKKSDDGDKKSPLLEF